MWGRASSRWVSTGGYHLETGEEASLYPLTPHCRLAGREQKRDARRNHFIFLADWMGRWRVRTLGVEMLYLARSESWNKEASHVACCVLGFWPGETGDCGKLGKEGSPLLGIILQFCAHSTRHFKWAMFSPALPLPSGSWCRNQ